jgi:hypothetical protein
MISNRGVNLLRFIKIDFFIKKLEHDSGVYLSIENSATLPLKTQPPL